MKVRSFFHPYVVCARPWDTLMDAAKLMRKGGFSCLPIFARDEMVGIITERDLVDAVADGGRPATSHVVDYMNGAPVTVSPDDDSAVTATRMLALGCRHLPVMEDGKLIGIVSARDLLLLAARPTFEELAAS